VTDDNGRLEPAAWIFKRIVGKMSPGEPKEEESVEMDRDPEIMELENIEAEPLVRVSDVRDLLTCDFCGSRIEWSENAGAYLCDAWDGCEGSCSPERFLERLRSQLQDVDDDTR